MAATIFRKNEEAVKNLGAWIGHLQESFNAYENAVKALNEKVDSNRKAEAEERVDCSDEWETINARTKEMKGIVSRIETLLN